MNGVVSIVAPLKSGEVTPTLSVVTVVLNDAANLEETIRSVLSQNFPDLEYVIVDGGSTDGTLDVIRRYEDRIDYWVSEPDKGVYDAMNKGIRKCRGELIKIINSGDVLRSGAVARVFAEIERNEEFQGCVMRSHLDLIDLDGKVIDVIDSGCVSRFYPSILHPSWYVPKAVYDKVGLYNADFAIAADYEFYRRALNHSVRFETLPESLVGFRVGGISGKGMAGQHEVLRINRRYQGTLIAVYVYALNVWARVKNRFRRLL
jgi:glycosyltransferase involved in cell wall biosynthesis